MSSKFLSENVLLEKNFHIRQKTVSVLQHIDENILPPLDVFL